MYNRTYKSSVLKSDKSAKVKKPFPWKRIVIGLILLAILFGVFEMIRAPKFQVANVLVEGNSVVDSHDVSSFVFENISGKYLRLLPRTSIFLISSSRLEVKIKEKFTRFQDVRVLRSTLNSLSVRVSEYEGKYLWCNVSDGEDAPCSFMDSNGLVFDRAPYFSGSAYIKIFGGEARDRYPFAPINKEIFDKLILLKDRLSLINIIVNKLEYISPHHIRASFTRYGNVATVSFDPSRDIEQSLDAFYSGLRTEPLSSMYRDQSKVLEYLDLRFNNKLVYKFK